MGVAGCEPSHVAVGDAEKFARFFWGELVVAITGSQRPVAAAVGFDHVGEFVDRVTVEVARGVAVDPNGDSSGGQVIGELICAEVEFGCGVIEIPHRLSIDEPGGFADFES